MPYNEFTLRKIREQFGLKIEEVTNLFAHIEELPVPPLLAALLGRQTPLALNLSTEKAKSELLVAPVLLELKFSHMGRISFFSGIEFTVDLALGLSGRCDFLLARSGQQLDLIAPVCVLVEAKNEDMIPGIPQAIAEMLAARRFNEQSGTPIEPIYGAVTTGLHWRFLKLEGNAAYVDCTEYSIQFPAKIFGILTAMALGE